MKKRMITLIFTLIFFSLIGAVFALQQKINEISDEKASLEMMLNVNPEGSSEVLEGQEKLSSELIPVVKMKLTVNYDMEADLLIDEINDKYVIYRYYDFQHTSSPNETQEKMPFNEIFATEVVGEGDKIPIYNLVIYLDYGDYFVELKVDSTFRDKFRNNKEFRENILKGIGKLMNKEMAHLINYRNR